MDDPHPDFIVIGAPRCGTTSLYHGLQQHPEIHMSPVREISYFAIPEGTDAWEGPGDEIGITDRKEYQALFAEADEGQLRGEVSCIYLSSPLAPERAHEALPDAKLIAILRNPVERAYSNYMAQRRRGREPVESFAKALDREAERLEAGWSPFWGYERIGYYGRQLERWMDLFDREQLRVLLFEEYIGGLPESFTDVFGFLGVDEDIEVDLGRQYNKSGLPRTGPISWFLESSSAIKDLAKRILPEGLQVRLWHKLRARTLVKPPLDPSVRERLIAAYEEDIRRTERLLDRDLSHWLEA